MAEPVFSVVVPTFARPARLRDCLAALADQTTAVPFEVIVVDDGSPAPVDGVVSTFRSRLDLRLIRQVRRGPGSARNAGAAEARGRYLAFTDDDCRPAPGWVAALAAAVTGEEPVLAGGRVENALVENAFSEASERIASFVYEYNRSGRALEPFFTTNNIAMSREAFHANGGFGEWIPSATAEDKEFCDRWRARGWTLSYVPDALVWHAHDLTLRSFMRQHYNYGRGILAFRELRARPAGAAIVPEPVTFYTSLLLSPLKQRPGRRRWRLVGLLVLSQVATVAGAARQALRRRQLRDLRSQPGGRD